ncbi:hypothetical protein D3C76_1769370 [compost metagenome]
MNVPLFLCRLEQAKNVIADVNFKTWKNSQRFAFQVLGHRSVLFDEVGEEPVPRFGFLRKVMVGDPDHLKFELVATS